ncbi:hypothetical protein PYCCODRAFT_5947 [Trametes coccinea BRFM310]|uniref:Uncharacterized protein n=1 Tax=Trametes coccinea (strain BRFM310) TaxID=1353009 RepID=A0A1Y2J4C3_TRAC3|nr:hypothetical protein PYCCODRAFT_5947 [Trametes coccinea BRFM310]
MGLGQLAPNGRLATCKDVTAWLSSTLVRNAWHCTSHTTRASRRRLRVPSDLPHQVSRPRRIPSDLPPNREASNSLDPSAMSSRSRSPDETLNNRSSDIYEELVVSLPGHY